jgi:hypothetical protein
MSGFRTDSRTFIIESKSTSTKTSAKDAPAEIRTKVKSVDIQIGKRNRWMQVLNDGDECF